MMVWRWCKILVALGLILSFVAWPKPSLAVPSSGISLQISPLPIELVTQPGGQTEADLRVRNAGDQTETLAVHILKVTEDDNGQVHLSQPGRGDDWVNWISFSRTVFEAPSNDWQTLHMTISPPASAAFGYYFAVEYTRATDQQPQPGQEVAHGAVATFVLLDVNAPGATKQAQLTSFVSNHRLYEYLPAIFSVKIKATGNIHVAPHGNIFINKGGKQVGSIEINAAEGNVLPASSRFFSAAWDDGFPVFVPRMVGGKPVVDKKSNPKYSLKWDFSKANRLRIGHYTAHLLMVYDNGQRDVPLEANLSFWVIPWKLILIGLIILALIIFGLWSGLRRLGRLAVKRRQ